MERYFGTYQTLRTVSKKDAALLMGSNTLVGDRYAIECVLEDGRHRAWLINKFGERIGYFEEDFSRTLSLYKADGMSLVGVLSFVAFTETPEPGEYWGQAAVIAYSPAYEAEFNRFINGVGSLIGKGIRPKLSFEGSAVDEIISSKGTWLPSDREPMPDKERGMALLKTRRGFIDGLVEAGRSGNKGCYVLSWAFLLALVAAVIFGLKSCGIF
jgi:hypothetical protein